MAKRKRGDVIADVAEALKKQDALRLGELLNEVDEAGRSRK